MVDRSFAFGAYILRTAVISGHESVGTYRRESFQLLGATHTGTIYESGDPESVPIRGWVLKSRYKNVKALEYEGQL